nr:unnamed protein product [Digitaria exilis]
MDGTVLCAANHVPLTPISFLQRAALVYPDRPAIVASSGSGPGSSPRTWRETWARCIRLAAALAGLGVSRHDVVAVFAQNIPAMCELHFGIPMAGAVICALNSRLDAAMASVLLQHSDAKVIFVDLVLLKVAEEALSLVACHHDEYEDLIGSGGGAPDLRIQWPGDENEPIALNYTSGTTSRPKGVVYSHRGAYLNSIATVLMTGMVGTPPVVHLWTVPMFHCNGWCLVWGVAATCGTNVCLRKVTAAAIFDCVARHGVTHMGGAPTVLSMIADAAAEDRRPLPGGRPPVTVKAGRAPPPPRVLLRMEALGFHVIHGYGMTETYGPATACAWKPEWDALPPEQRASVRARQGLHHLGLQEVDVRVLGFKIEKNSEPTELGEFWKFEKIRTGIQVN